MVFVMFKSIILTAIVTSVSCFAEWRDSRDITNDLISKSEESSDLMKKYKAINEFGNYHQYSTTPGIHLFATNIVGDQGVHLRINGNNVDYKVFIHHSINNESISLSLNLLDADRYLIESVWIANLGSKYQGVLMGSFTLETKKVSEIKYYTLTMSEK